MGFSRQEYWSGVPSPSPRIWLGVSEMTRRVLGQHSAAARLNRCTVILLGASLCTPCNQFIPEPCHSCLPNINSILFTHLHGNPLSAGHSVQDEHACLLPGPLLPSYPPLTCSPHSGSGNEPLKTRMGSWDPAPTLRKPSGCHSARPLPGPLSTPPIFPDSAPHILKAEPRCRRLREA